MSIGSRFSWMARGVFDATHHIFRPGLYHQPTNITVGGHGLACGDMAATSGIRGFVQYGPQPTNLILSQNAPSCRQNTIFRQIVALLIGKAAESGASLVYPLGNFCCPLAPKTWGLGVVMAVGGE